MDEGWGYRSRGRAEMLGRELLINRGTPRNAEEVSKGGGRGGGGRKEGRTGWESVFRPNFSMKNKLAGAINPRIDRAKLLPLPSPLYWIPRPRISGPNFYINLEMAVDHGIRNETKIGRLVSDSLGVCGARKRLAGPAIVASGLMGGLGNGGWKTIFVASWLILSLFLYIYKTLN